MSLRTKIGEIIRKWGWRGLLAGFLISVLIQPFAVSFATDVFVFVGAPGYEEPHIESEFDGVGTIYKQNQAVNDFEGLHWKSDFELVRFWISNPTTRFLQNVKVTLPLPSCAVYTNTEGPSVHGDYSVSNPHTARIQSVDALQGKDYSCTKEINLGTLAPDESASVEFVIRQEFSKCDRLTGIHPENEYTIKYVWRAHNKIFQKEETVSFEDFNPQENYNKALKQEPATAVGPHSAENSDWEYYAILVGVDATDWDSGLKKCLISNESG